MRTLRVPRRPCDVENPDDFNTYYRGAVIGLETNEKTVPHLVLGYHGNLRNTFTLAPLTPTPAAAVNLAFRELRDQLSFGSPEYGMVNVGPTCIYTYITAIRAASRGFRPASTHFTVFNNWELRKKAIDCSPSNPDAAENLFNPQYYGVEEAIENLDKGERVGCTISNTLGLFTSGSSSAIQIAYRREAVGYLSDTRAFIAAQYSGIRKILANQLHREVVVV